MQVAAISEGRYLRLSRMYWWKHDIAKYYGLSPREVETWDSDEILECLARIADDLAHNKNKNK